MSPARSRKNLVITSVLAEFGLLSRWLVFGEALSWTVSTASCLLRYYKEHKEHLMTTTVVAVIVVEREALRSEPIFVSGRVQGMCVI